MLFTKTRLFALVSVGAASLSLAGCFQSKTKAIEVGEELGVTGKAYCTTFGSQKVEQLPVPEKVPGGGVVYRVGDGVFTFKKINRNLYLAQTEAKGIYKFGYVYIDAKKLRTLAYPPQMTEGTRRSIEAAGLTVNPGSDGFQDLAGKPADLQRFLLSPNVDSLAAFSDCSFEKPTNWGPPLIGQIRKNFTRDDVLSMVGATECGEDVCFHDLGMAVTEERSLKKAHGEIRLTFNDQGVRQISIKGQDLDLRWENKALNQSVLSLFPVAYSGDESSIVFLRVNDDGVLYRSPTLRVFPTTRPSASPTSSMTRSAGSMSYTSMLTSRSSFFG
ncbi:hypothetical protein [Microvirga calopogonii]|uniref:hypothetical protein n=1 Tax=Microvirga calopogonii TaxID=2078013 RepID=UPI000E0D81E5|nr:hypothetical protein [Microvirga calopogonii]